MPPADFFEYLLYVVAVAVPFIAVAFAYGGAGAFRLWVMLVSCGCGWLAIQYFQLTATNATGMELLGLFFLASAAFATGLIAGFSYMVVGAIGMLPDQRTSRKERRRIKSE